jgi:dTDP-glucose 4,6-dehydratase
LRKLSHILVTGGAGFIGSNFIRYLFSLSDFQGTIVNLDKLTYAGNLDNLRAVQARFDEKRYFFERADICDSDILQEIFQRYEIDTVFHFAAESHVDRSIFGPADFIETNIVGTFRLLEAARAVWQTRSDVLFHHVSTDEVYGSLGATDYFTERSSYDPRSPYSASKASSDHLVRAANHTYGLPITISNCSNNYGPYQFPEKLIPLVILNILEEKPIPVYGDGSNVRDWLHVDDHSSALWLIANRGKSGETYNIGGENEWKNIDLVHSLCSINARLDGKQKDYYEKLITFVKDRPGHDQRYAIDCSKIKNELGWSQMNSFPEGLEKTVLWYRENKAWVERIKSGGYRDWIEKNYKSRLETGTD